MSYEVNPTWTAPGACPTGQRNADTNLDGPAYKAGVQYKRDIAFTVGYTPEREEGIGVVIPRSLTRPQWTVGSSQPRANIADALSRIGSGPSRHTGSMSSWAIRGMSITARREGAWGLSTMAAGCSAGSPSAPR